MSHNKTFQNVGALKPRRTVFDLSYRKNFTCDMGQLIPIMADECVPGDHFKIGNEVVVRFQPLVAPIMHEVSVSVHYFFVPYRILWDEWEDFISQGQLGGASPLPIQLPTYAPRTNDGYNIGSLWDYLGFPVNWEDGGQAPTASTTPVIDFPFRAYNMIYNEYYRDENLQQELPIDESPQYILNRNWKKDYFTSALPFRQKGTPPALPVNSQLTLNINRVPYNSLEPLQWNAVNPPSGRPFVGALSTVQTIGTGSSMGSGNLANPSASTQIPTGYWAGVDPDGIATKIFLERAYNVQSTTFDVADLRLAFQTQKWLERNARGGTRYTEFLRSHFGVSPTDARLDRPEYIGGTKSPVIVSEVLQTSQSTSSSPQAQFAGHGLTASGQFAGSYNVQEYGLIMGIMSVMPKPAYQNGVNRQWLRRLPTDFYFPEFAHLSEQGIYQSELYYGGGDNGIGDANLFGYCGQYDEMRIKHDIVCSEMRVGADGSPQLSYWNLAQNYLNPPNLNSDFITCIPDKRIFAVQNVPGLIVNVQNLITAVRPLPAIAEPGLIDHF